MRTKELIEKLKQSEDIPVCKSIDHEYDDEYGEISNYFDGRVYRLTGIFERSDVVYLTFSDEKEELDELKKSHIHNDDEKVHTIAT